MKWNVHRHASEQVQKRFGIRPEHVNNFVNQMMEHSVKVHCKEEGREAYAHKTKDFFAAVNPAEGLVITVIDKAAEQVAVRSPFLDEVLPKMKRELIKMERDFNRKKRVLDKAVAEATIARGEALLKCTRVNNPETQSILKAQAYNSAREITNTLKEIAALKADYEVASVKLQRFIWTSEERVE